MLRAPYRHFLQGFSPGRGNPSRLPGGGGQVGLRGTYSSRALQGSSQGGIRSGEDYVGSMCQHPPSPNTLLPPHFSFLSAQGKAWATPPVSHPPPPKAPPDPPWCRLVSTWGPGAKNGRVNWGKLTRRKTPQHLEKQELGPGEGGQSLGCQNPSGAIIHPSVRGLPPAPPPTRLLSLWFQRRTNGTLCWARLSR